MDTRWTYFLDENGDAPVPPGYRLVEYDIDLLREMFGDEPLFIRGHNLCSWSKEACDARGWPYEYRRSPAEELQECSPQLDLRQARHLAARLGDRLPTLTRPLRPAHVAAELRSAFAWDEDPGPTHAARWLLWLVESEPGEAEQVLLRSVSFDWQVRTSDPEAWAYTADSEEEAWPLLQGWLRVTDSETNWSPFPLADLPGDIVQRLRKGWRKEAIASKGRFFDDLLGRAPQDNILREAAEVAAKYFSKNPDSLSKERLERLSRYLTAATEEVLLGVVPPADPGEFSDNFSSVVQWFRDRYLAFRRWEVTYGAEGDHLRVRELAREFGRWYLDAYLRARAGGADSDRLSWSKAASISDASPSYATLLVVLDGLGYLDSIKLTQLISDRSDRLALDAQEIAFSPLPTITPFAKPSLLKGLNPARALDDAENIGSLEKRDSRVVEALAAAEPGEIVIWSLGEPDKAYHAREEREAILEEVAGRLQSLAGRIAKVVHGVPDRQPLKLVITTDHGRLLGASRRAHPVPHGMQAQGRAAWGQIGLVFPAEGYVIEDEVAYLHAGRFGLHEPCAVLISDDSFLTSDGRSGNELFAHGGLYPEEVFIPWLEYTRDRSPVDLEVALKGRGVAGSEGELQLSVDNPSELAVRLTRLEISINNIYFDLTETVDSMSSERVHLSWASWPSKQDLQDVEVKLLYSVPSGEIQTVAIVSSLESEELYVKDDILGDLGGLDEF